MMARMRKVSQVIGSVWLKWGNQRGKGERENKLSSYRDFIALELQGDHLIFGSISCSLSAMIYCTVCYMCKYTHVCVYVGLRFEKHATTLIL